MKPLVFAVLLAASSTAFAQPLQKPVFYTPTLQVTKSEVKGNTKTEVIYRRQIIVLGFLPRTEAGETHATTAPLALIAPTFSLTGEFRGRDFDEAFRAMEAELVAIQGAASKLQGWSSIATTGPASTFVPVETLDASPQYGHLIFCVNTQRFSIESVRDDKTWHFQGDIHSYISGPTSFALEKARRGVKTWHGNFDIQTLPDAAQMEALVGEF